MWDVVTWLHPSLDRWLHSLRQPMARLDVKLLCFYPFSDEDIQMSILESIGY